MSSSSVQRSCQGQLVEFALILLSVNKEYAILLKAEEDKHLDLDKAEESLRCLSSSSMLMVPSSSSLSTTRRKAKSLMLRKSRGVCPHPPHRQGGQNPQHRGGGQNPERVRPPSQLFPLLLVYKEDKLLSVKEEDRCRAPSRPDHQD